jgi:predicted peroxiredoxin
MYIFFKLLSVGFFFSSLVASMDDEVYLFKRRMSGLELFAIACAMFAIGHALDVH